METFIDISSRTNWRILHADGHSARLTRDGAAKYLRAGRKLGRKWLRVSDGWSLR